MQTWSFIEEPTASRWAAIWATRSFAVLEVIWEREVQSGKFGHAKLYQGCHSDLVMLFSSARVLFTP